MEGIQNSAQSAEGGGGAADFGASADAVDFVGSGSHATPLLQELLRSCLALITVIPATNAKGLLFRDYL